MPSAEWQSLGGPGGCIPGQPTFIVDHAYLVRRLSGPIPKHDVAVGCTGIGGEAWNDDASDAGPDQARCQLPGWRLDPARREVLPRTGQIARGDRLFRQGSRIG